MLCSFARVQPASATGLSSRTPPQVSGGGFEPPLFSGYTRVMILVVCRRGQPVWCCVWGHCFADDSCDAP